MRKELQHGRRFNPAGYLRGRMDMEVHTVFLQGELDVY